MKHLTYNEILRTEFTNRTLFDEVIEVNEENRQKREFVEKNRLFNIQ